MDVRRAWMRLSIVAVAVFVAACGTSTGSATPGASEPGAPTGQPTAEVTASPQATSADIGGAAAGLSNLTSYKVSMSIEGSTTATVDVVVVKGPPKAISFSEVSSGTSIKIIEIGTDVWVDEGSGTYIKNALPASAIDSMMSAFDPGSLVATINNNGELAAITNLGVETKNGVQATHYHADEHTQLPPGSSPIPAGATADLWLATNGGYLVAMEVVNFPSEKGSETIKVEVTNINDSGLKISPPS